ncbi:MAG: cobyric acid synthase [Actinomycetota bacterium]
MRGGLLVAGTSSDAGKSVLVAGICRLLARRGVKVAPFKAQNMALNSAVTFEGAEIGRAQAAQAMAAGIEPEVAMNPVLLKPTSDRRSQVVVMGRPAAEMDARSYHEFKPRLMPVVLGALEDLRSRFDVVVCEGAGSLAEINLREGDLVNMGLAREAGLPVLVVGDIDRGGVFASLYGSLALLDPADQSLVAAFVINKFRGDRDVLAPGIERIASLTGRPVLGVLPWIRGMWLDSEDSLALDGPGIAVRAPLGKDRITVAVIRLRWISNFTDFEALACEPGVSVRFTDSPADVLDADLVVLPGTKATAKDLDWLRARGLDEPLRARVAAGQPLLGICGGYQILGRRVVDEVEGRVGEVEGLGLLPVETVFGADKVLARPSGTALFFGGAAVSGYEIRHGRPRRIGGEPVFETPQGEEGCRVGAVVGTSWHGVLECDEFRRALLGWVAGVRGLDWVPGSERFADLRERRFDALADLMENHLDCEELERLIDAGPPAGLPILAPAGSPLLAPAGVPSVLSAGVPSGLPVGCPLPPPGGSR